MSSWATIARRRRRFTTTFAIEKLGFDAESAATRLKPGDSPHPIELYCSDFSGIWSDQRFDRLAFGWLAHLFAERGLLDHAWTITFASKPFEPWVLVSEPYSPEPSAVASLAEYLTVIGMDLVTYPTELSPWNPGGTTPLAACVAKPGSIDGLFSDAAGQIAIACGVRR